jgi:hypothetical protein
LISEQLPGERGQEPGAPPQLGIAAHLVEVQQQLGVGMGRLAHGLSSARVGSATSSAGRLGSGALRRLTIRP